MKKQIENVFQCSAKVALSGMLVFAFGAGAYGATALAPSDSGTVQTAQASAESDIEYMNKKYGKGWQEQLRKDRKTCESCKTSYSIKGRLSHFSLNGNTITFKGKLKKWYMDSKKTTNYKAVYKTWKFKVRNKVLAEPQDLSPHGRLSVKSFYKYLKQSFDIAGFSTKGGKIVCFWYV